ncbi:DUF402 domain-containing protein [Neobacillus kokaensis]|uniref:DUF402 domain-containing protein n=1 Tax=Neobacillus kokaensis TaxID=2759023 RepID=A0ABQ3N8B1_9BACI|nr:DUF402 domain-containing protein [Neobacillus kokaensis]GHH98770.1 hypothetical protein AM1BK_23130 [Neobacillus kokaensis]
MNNTLKIKALKYPDIPHYEWEGTILESTPDYIIVHCKYGRQLVHHTKNKVFTITNTSIEYFSLKEWFTAALEVEDGAVVSGYCNVAMPSVLKNNEVSFVDLDLDYIQKKNQKWEVVDEDEFESNSVKYQYPPELKQEALLALDRLQHFVKSGRFPFNQEIVSLLNGV